VLSATWQANCGITQKTRIFPRKALPMSADSAGSCMGAVERGEKNITLAMVNKVAKDLKISLAELFKSV
jgi:hypothetical protein